MPTTDDGWDAAARIHSIIAAYAVDIAGRADRLHALRPGLKLIAYDLGPYVNRDSELFTTTMREHPEYFARDTAGNLIGVPAFPKMVLMDQGMEGWRQLHVQRALGAAARVDGVFVDSMGPAPTSTGFTAAKPVNPLTGAEYTAAEWVALSRLTLDAVKVAVGTQLVIFNGLGNGPTYKATTNALAASTADGGMAEGFVRGASEPVTTYPTKAAWVATLDMVTDMARRGKVLLGWTKLWTAASATERAKWNRFALATSLLGRGNATFYNFLPTEGVNRAAVFYANQQTQLGAPLRAYRVRNGVYTRAFSNGTVTVNPTTRAASIALKSNPGPRPPIVVAQFQPISPNHEAWLRQPSGVSWVVTDAGRGVTATSGCDSVSIVANSPGETIGPCSVSSMDGTSTSTVVVGLDLDLPTATTDGVEVVSPQDLTGTATDALSGVAMLLVQWNGGAPSTSYTMRAELACDSTRRSCVWSAASPPIGSYTVTLQVTDVADLTSDAVIGTVTVAEPI